MNVAYQGPWPRISDADALLMDVARSIQLTPTKHQIADRNFRALCRHVDREGSPFKGLVSECYPSGSFATGTAIAAQVKRDIHDVDVAIELNVDPCSSPAYMLGTLFEAINGDRGSAYYGTVKQNTRCVTVTYADGTKVDLMPIARIDYRPERVGNLFHFKAETGDAFHKVVNPWGFKEYFNSRVAVDEAFYKMFKGRRLLVEGDQKIAADIQPMPEHAPLEEKSPRVVAIQLIKRGRDIAFRRADRRGMRKPPSVVLAAIALEAGPVCPSLVDEVISVANAIRNKLAQKDARTRLVTVCNPAYPEDVFTDRWPETEHAQDAFSDDMRRMIVDMYRLRNESLSLPEKTELLKRVFGESVASRAIESLLDAGRHEMEAGRFNVGPRGPVFGALAAPAAIGAGTRTAAAKVGLREGGGTLPE
jgi:hypothetical protein